MKPHEKLVFIQECCEHEDEYRPNNKGKFWSMIGELLKQKTGYELVHPMQMVTRWVKARIVELVEEEMGSGTEVKRDDFKTAVEQFAKRMVEVAREIDDAVKSRQQRAAENFEAARLKNSLVFQVDDELIPGVDTPAANSNSSRSSSIALAPRASKRKREAEPMDQPSTDTMLFSTGFKEATTILANAYCASQSQTVESIASIEALEKKLDQMEANVQSIADRILHAPTLPPPPANNEALEK